MPRTAGPPAIWTSTRITLPDGSKKRKRSKICCEIYRDSAEDRRRYALMANARTPTTGEQQVPATKSSSTAKGQSAKQREVHSAAEGSLATVQDEDADDGEVEKADSAGPGQGKRRRIKVRADVSRESPHFSDSDCIRKIQWRSGSRIATSFWPS